MKQVSNKLTSGLPTLGKFITSNRTFQAYAATAQKFGGQAKGGALWAAPGGLFVLWMVAPALTDNFRSSLGLPKSKESLPSQAKYMLEEIDQMPVKR